MARTRLGHGEKPLHWVGSSKKELLGFPEAVISDLGYALGLAQLGGKHPLAKSWKGQGPGVFELVEDYRANAYRVIYTVRFDGAIYVLHTFQKKSPKGIKTAQKDIELVARRLKAAQGHHDRQYGRHEG